MANNRINLTASDSFIQKRAKECLSGNHVKGKWVSTGPGSGKRDHEPTGNKEECIFCAYMTSEELEKCR